MPKARYQDNFVAYIAAAVVVTLLCVFVFSWGRIGTAIQPKPKIVYAQFGPFQVETQNFSVTANLSVQTSTDDAGWANDHRQLLDVILKKVLADTDVKTMKTAAGLQILQEELKNGCNTEMGSDTVQAVLLTDFVFQPH